MLGADVDARASADSKQLEVIRSVDMYLRSGAFSAHDVSRRGRRTMSDVMYDGRFGVVRAAETWSKRDVVPDPMELLLLESEMNRYLPLYPQVILCLYDLDRFGAGIIVDLLKTHPQVLVGGIARQQPVPPDPRRAAHRHHPAPRRRDSDSRDRGGSQLVLGRDDWLDLARKVDWTHPLRRRARRSFPPSSAATRGSARARGANWNEAYRTTYREYVANQREKDAAVLGRAARR